jgi:hypothetical protein
MPWRMLTAEILVTIPILIEYRNGLFHTEDRLSDDLVIRRAIPPHIYLANFKRAQEALAKWCDEQRRATVIPLKPEDAQRLGAS